MTIKKTIDEARDLTILDVAGPVSEEEMYAGLEDFYTRPTMLLLWDMSQADVRYATADALEAFARRSVMLGAQRKGGRTAVFAPENLQFGLARMSETFNELNSAPFKFKVFRSRKNAIDWLTAEDSS